jgi:hypothetical protein
MLVAGDPVPAKMASATLSAPQLLPLVQLLYSTRADRGPREPPGGGRAST